jgi:hypothetical protein
MSLTDEEIQFLRWHNLSQEDVYDGRHQSKRSREAAAKSTGKDLILVRTSSACRAAGHRIKTRAGHCFQCDPLNLVYLRRHSTPGYVYVAGSLSGRAIKIGTAGDIPQRERQLRAERYAGFADWEVLFSIQVREAGRVEHDAASRVPGQRVFRNYVKDGYSQTAIEVIKCSFSAAVKAIKESLGPTDNAEPWEARWTYPYEFDHEPREAP